MTLDHEMGRGPGPVGDERNALVMLTVEANLGHGAMPLPAARGSLIDEAGKIAAEQVIFFATPAA